MEGGRELGEFSALHSTPFSRVSSSASKTFFAVMSISSAFFRSLMRAHVCREKHTILFRKENFQSNVWSEIDYDTIHVVSQVDVPSLIISARKTKKGLMKTNVYKDNEKSFFSPPCCPTPSGLGMTMYSYYKTFDNKSQSIK